MNRFTSRAHVIQMWFGGVVLIIVATIAAGINVTASTASLLGALSLVPPAIVLMLWPGARLRTASDVIHDTNR